MGLHQDPTFWERFVRYARYIRSVDMNTTTESGETGTLQTLLHKMGPGRTLFPGLQTLELVSTPCVLSSLSVLFTSTLHSITIIITEDIIEDIVQDSELTYAMISATKSLLDSSSQLRSLCLQKGYTFLEKSDLLHDDTGPGRLLLHTISDFRHLQALTLTLPCALAASEVLTIIALPTLNDVTLENVFGTHSDLTMLSRQRVTSPALQTCDLSGNSVGVRAVIAGIYAPQLHSVWLTLEVDGLDPTQDFCSCTAAVTRAIDTGIFESYNVVLRNHDQRQDIPARLVDILRSLMSLEMLGDFQLSCRDIPFTATDPGLAYLFDVDECRWPKLLDLDLNIFWLDDRAAPSSALLHYLRMSCPSLQTLELPYLRPNLNLEKPLMEEVSDLLKYTHPLEMLHIAPVRQGHGHGQAHEESVADDVVMWLARYVHALFPKISLGGDMRDHTTSEVWGRIFSTINSM